MNRREEIQKERILIKAKMDALKAQDLDLLRESQLLCDDEQWFTEKEEEIVLSKRPKKTEKRLIGRIHWNENFKDESDPDGDGVTIERTRVVKVNGEWINGSYWY